MKKILALLVILNLFQHPICSQNKKIDSLLTELQKARYDTTRFRLYLALLEECDVKDNLKYAEPAVKLADKLLTQSTNEKERRNILGKKADAIHSIRVFYQDKNDTAKFLEYQQKLLSINQQAKDTENIIGAIRTFSNFYISIGNFPKAIEYGQKGLSVSMDLKYKKGIAGCLLEIGNMYRDQGEPAQALENYQQSLSILYEIKDTSYLVNALNSMGVLYGQLLNIEKSRDFFHMAISLSDKSEVWWLYAAMGGMFKENKDYENSLLNYQKSLSIAEEKKNKVWVKESLDNIGMLYTTQGDIDKALSYHFKALKIAKEELKSENGIAWSYLRLVRAYQKQKNYKMAKDYSERSLKMKNQFDIGTIGEAELITSQIDSANGNGNGAYEHYKQYIILRDKLKSEEVYKAAAKEKFQSEYDKQKAIDKTEQEKKDAVAKAEIKRQTLIRNSTFGGVGITGIFSFILLRSFNRRRKTAFEKQ
ncbi:MAG: tetratricopeptide repeat protein, partial [Bacteroidota bacterium]